VLRVLHGWRRSRPAAPAAPTAATLRPLLSALLAQLAQAPHALSQSDVLGALSALADLGLGPDRATDATLDSAGADAAAVHELLRALATAPGGEQTGLSGAPPGALAAMLVALRRIGVAPEGAFLSAAQDELRASLAGGGGAGGAAPGLSPGAFCAFAGAVAAFGYRLEQQLLDGYLEAAEPHLGRMHGGCRRRGNAHPEWLGQDRRPAAVRGPATHGTAENAPAVRLPTAGIDCHFCSAAPA
jgi:hypothetical protein